MKIVLLLFALIAAFSFAMKKTFDSRVLLAERLQAERTMTYERNITVAQPRTVVMI